MRRIILIRVQESIGRVVRSSATAAVVRQTPPTPGLTHITLMTMSLSFTSPSSTSRTSTCRCWSSSGSCLLQPLRSVRKLVKQQFMQLSITHVLFTVVNLIYEKRFQHLVLGIPVALINMHIYIYIQLISYIQLYNYMYMYAY